MKKHDLSNQKIQFAWMYVARIHPSFSFRGASRRRLFLILIRGSFEAFLMPAFLGRCLLQDNVFEAILEDVGISLRQDDEQERQDEAR